MDCAAYDAFIFVRTVELCRADWWDLIWILSELRLPAVEFLRELLTYMERIGCYFLIIASRMSA